MTEIVVDPALQAFIDPLTPDEFATLERSILAEGCRDALVLWGNVLVDGHNRYAICQKHGLPFRTVQNERFQSMEDVQLWMIDQHLGRRSVSDFQRGVMALRKREIIQQRRAQASPVPPEPATGDAATPPWEDSQDGAAAAPAPAATAPQTEASVDAAEAEALATREALAKAARLSSNQLRLIETIQRNAAPEIVAAVRSGDLSINAAAAVAQLAPEEQQAAAEGGKQALQQAAKRVRESRRKPKADSAPAAAPDGTSPPAEAAPTPASSARIAELEQQVAALTAENERLREQVKVLQELLAEQG